MLAGRRFGETGQTYWIPQDVNCDGVISVLVVILAGQRFGQHTDEILAEPGYTKARIRQLRKAEVIG